MKTKLITLLIAIVALLGSANAQKYDRKIQFHKNGELITTYDITDVDSITFLKVDYLEASYSVSPVGTGSVTIDGSNETPQYVLPGTNVTYNATPQEGYSFVNWTVNGEVVSTENPYTANITANTEFVANFEKGNTENGHEYVDLGLSVKWATCNVGANTPEEYGDYFAWGETGPKTNYNWSTYKWCNGRSATMTKYCTYSEFGTVDNKTMLDLEDDAAHVNWGGNWRMPTYAEQDELRNTSNCTWTWTTKNGVKGYKVTSKKNGNSIFLPAAGYHGIGNLIGAGSRGYYWSGSLDTSFSDYAYRVNFNISGVNLNYAERFNGLPVRAVCE